MEKQECPNHPGRPETQRGVCGKCYAQLLRKVKSGDKTWAELEAAGIVRRDARGRKGEAIEFKAAWTNQAAAASCVERGCKKPATVLAHCERHATDIVNMTTHPRRAEYHAALGCKWPLRSGE